jgi:DNA polymerase-1
MKDKEIGEAEVLEKFGVPPAKVIDVQSLSGDSVDNIPGVPGIGVKTGALLINEYGDLETLLARASEIKQQKRRESLIEFAEQARLSKRLVTLRDDVPVEHDAGSFAVDTPKASQLIGFLKALEFSSFTKKVAGELDADMAAIDPIPVEIKYWPPEEGGEQPSPDPSSRRKPGPISPPAGTTPDRSPPLENNESAKQAEASLLAIPIRHADYETVLSLDSLDHWIAAAYDEGFIAVDTETDALDAMQAGLVGVSLALAPGKACYIPLAHKSDGSGLFGGEPIAGQIKLEDAIARLKPLLEDPRSSRSARISNTISRSWPATASSFRPRRYHADFLRGIGRCRPRHG